jgi:hypothetical protein
MGTNQYVKGGFHDLSQEIRPFFDIDNRPDLGFKIPATMATGQNSGFGMGMYDQDSISSGR